VAGCLEISSKIETVFLSTCDKMGYDADVFEQNFRLCPGVPDGEVDAVE